ncbi:MAG: NADH dehydrogenase subunit, partial [Oscillospiraceae bacterium]|nr:NADH dehydrogenase subunit [Oscillospiraceae bacterium]
ITGNRVNYAMNTIGGARRDIDDDKRRLILEAMDDLEKKMAPLTHFLTTDKTVAMRTKGVGVLTTEDAIRLGAVGPHARASGVDMDVRRDAPYSSYGDFEFAVPVQQSCDVYARVVIRVLEIYESIKIIRQAVDQLPEGPINLGTKMPKVPAGEFVARHEAPRGHLVYKVVTDGSPKNYRLSLHVPTFKNAPTVPTMLKGNTVADAGLIVASNDPCFSCLDR